MVPCDWLCFRPEPRRLSHPLSLQTLTSPPPLPHLKPSPTISGLGPSSSDVLPLRFPTTVPQAQSTSDSAIQDRSVQTTVQTTVHETLNYTIHPPKPSSPLRTNAASAQPANHQTQTQTPQSESPLPLHLPTTDPIPVSPSPRTTAATRNARVPKENAPPKTWAQKAKASTDRSLQRLAPTTTLANGTPRVAVPDEVFQRGADLHKEFLVGTFLGKMPDLGPIQSVLNYMWGKGTKLKIHLQPFKRSFLVRVPNDFIRSKALEKRLWYVGTAMFHVSQWSSSSTCTIPEITSIPLWAHLTGVPFDLRTKEGLSLAAGLVGEPIETDDYTKNLTDLNIAHVKVEADLTKPLPSYGELLRQNGDIIPIDINYPWVPPSCTHCLKIGHVVKDCIFAPTPADVHDSPDTNAPVLVPDRPDEVPDPPDDDVIQDPSEPADTIMETITSTEPETCLSDPSLVLAPDPSVLPLDPPTNPIFVSNHILSPSQASASTKPPIIPLSSSSPPLSPPPIQFSNSPSKASFVFGIPATYAPTFGSYICTKQALAFNAPAITLPPQYSIPSRPSLVFCASKSASEPMLNNILSRVCPRWNYVSNHQSDDDGRIIFIWKSPAVVTLLNQSRQSLTCEVCLPTMPKLIVTAVYASNLAAERVDLWAELISIQQTYSLHLSPWLVAGDFNQITHPREHSSPSVQSSTSAMIQFRDSLLHMGLFDLRFQGSLNTWSNKCPSSPITKKLDRVLVNHEWIISVPQSSAIFLPPEFSDHSPSLIDLASTLPIAGTKPFKFFNYLTKHPSFLETVTEAWILAGISSTCLSDLSWKLKSLKSVLQKINSENYSKIQERVLLANGLLKDVQGILAPAVLPLQNAPLSWFQELIPFRLAMLDLPTLVRKEFKDPSQWLQVSSIASIIPGLDRS
ncbi:hypothetical protein IGI04_018122 [Brassica rapa subsp. trilocularis]|uniref:DUF4283 domain-containing protein n=1 Tax=Brassica rapa subsp. trilocularis TaxID=1813537 RepID=A0ABQ7MC12_BRACM|nr:hypothetical protein IGI04_018122 [Brassica rapa subsp. trilocularis]